MSVRIVGLGGSLSEGSSSLSALNTALDAAAAAGAETDIVDIRALSLPFYRVDYDTLPGDAVKLINTVANADAMIWSAPMYHGTVSGAFKNALD